MALVTMTGKVAGKIFGQKAVQKIGEDGKPVVDKHNKPVMVNPEISYQGLTTDSTSQEVMAAFDNDSEKIRLALIDAFNSAALEAARDPFAPFLSSITDADKRSKVRDGAKVLVELGGLSYEDAVSKILANIK
jgi:hypothetical protein